MPTKNRARRWGLRADRPLACKGSERRSSPRGPHSRGPQLSQLCGPLSTISPSNLLFLPTSPSTHTVVARADSKNGEDGRHGPITGFAHSMHNERSSERVDLTDSCEDLCCEDLALTVYGTPLAAVTSLLPLSSPSPWHRLITSICRLEAVGLASSQMVLKELTDRSLPNLKRLSVLLFICVSCMGTSVRSGSRGRGWCLFSTVTSCQAVFRMAASEEAASSRARLRRRISSLLLSTWSLDAIFLLPPWFG